MPRPASEVLTEREAQIMHILWDLGEASSETIREHLDDGSHNSSVRTILRVMKEKGHVRTKPRSRPTLYRAAVSRSQVQKKVARGFLRRFFDGSPEALVLRLLDDQTLTWEQLEQLKQSQSTTDNRKKRKRGKS